VRRTKGSKITHGGGKDPQIEPEKKKKGGRKVGQREKKRQTVSGIGFLEWKAVDKGGPQNLEESLYGSNKKRDIL